jgi:hypothetical protein
MADINLTTTAVTPTTTTVATLRARLRRELHDEDAANYRWTDAVLERHLARALREVGMVLPREQRTALTATAGSRELSLAVLSDLVRIEAVEWPTGQWPPGYAPFSVWAGTLTLLTETAPAGAEAVNVYWGRLHTLDSSSSTLPALAEDVVVLGAGAYAALEWANYAVNRVNVGGVAADRDYGAWGRERLREFEEALGKLGKEAEVRVAAMYKPERQAGRHTVSW